MAYIEDCIMIVNDWVIAFPWTSREKNRSDKTVNDEYHVSLTGRCHTPRNSMKFQIHTSCPYPFTMALKLKSLMGNV
jgi:hypothetical protein